MFAETITHTYYFENPKIKVVDGYSEINFENCCNFGKEGEPLLPFLGAHILLPMGLEATNIKIIHTRYSESLENIIITPAGKQVPLSHIMDSNYKVSPNTEVYNSIKPLPEKIVENLNTQFLCGHSIALFTICPVIYIPAKKQVSFIQEITIEIETEPTNRANEAEEFLKQTPDIKRRLERTVDNPEIIERYSPYIQGKQGRNPDYDLLLITNSTLLNYFNSYVNFQTESGYKIATEVVSDIYTNYSGSDNQEKIRNCIKDYYTNHNIISVILGGDDDIIPHRGLCCSDGSYPGNTCYDIPADLYYACLDRSSAGGSGPDWNNDGDDKWGEVDEADLYAEVTIGRYPVNTQTDVNNMVNKLQMYINSPVTADIEKAIMVGEYLGSGPSGYGKDYKEEIRNGSSAHGYTTAGFPANYTVETLYDMDNTWSYTEIFTKFNNGLHLLNHIGHGAWNYNLKMYNSSVTTTNFQNNGTNHNFVIEYSQACHSGAFDNNDCFGEVITTLETGEIAFIGNSREGWGSSSTNASSQHFDREFFDAIFGESIYKLGEINQDSKESWAPYLSINPPTMRWCYYEINILGDPTLDIYTATPVAMNANYPPGVAIGTTQISFNTDAPYARIGLMQDGSQIGSGVADANGDIILNLYSSISSYSDINVSIIGHNKIRHQGLIIISNQPYVIYSSHNINDASGNNNGQPDSGENILLDMTLINNGDQTAENVNATLSTSDAYITITDNTEIYPSSIPAGQTSTQTDAFAFTISDNIPDQHQVDFSLQVTGDGAKYTWNSSFSITVNAPIVAYNSHNINDASGNNNGQPDSGENILLDMTLINNGDQTAENVNATLSTSDAYITITDNTEIYPSSIPAGQTSTQTDAFAFTISDNIPDQHQVDFSLQVTGDGAKYTWNSSFSITVNAPHFSIGDMTIDDAGGNGNGYLDPDETVDLIIPTKNDGHLNSSNATGNLYCTNQYITINSGTHNFGVINIGITKNATFNITVSSGIPPNEQVTFNYDITAGSYDAQASFTVTDNRALYTGGSGDGYAKGETEGGSTLSLPVVLSKFTIQFIGNAPLLNWITQSETNNIGWNIYRSENDSLEQAFQINMELIPGAGTTSEPTEYTYEDEYVVYENTTYWYWLESIEYSGITTIYEPTYLTVPEGGGEPQPPEIPFEYGLHQNYPNPYNANTEISFVMNEDCIGELSIYNIKGQRVKTLFSNKPITKDKLVRTSWNGKDESGKRVGSGIYYYKLDTNKKDYLRKMIIFK